MKNKYSLENYTLLRGSHEVREDGMCAMEFVAYLAKEPHSAAPVCACPILTGFITRINDRFTEEERQKLKPFLPRLLGTRDGKSMDRMKLLAHRACVVLAAESTEIRGFKDQAAILRDVKFGEWEDQRKKCRDASYAYAAANAAAYAANAAAYAANAAAYAAANAAANAAAYAAYAAAYAAANAADAATLVSVGARSRIVDLILQTLSDAIEVGKKIKEARGLKGMKSDS